MTRVIAHEMDGQCAITHTSPSHLQSLAQDGVTGDDALRAVARAAGMADFILLDDSSLPALDEFFNAWRIQGDAVEIDLGAAREVKREMIRTERAERWTEADARYNIAHESGVQADVQSAARYRQRLRDAPAHPDIESAADADALAAITLDDLL